MINDLCGWTCVPTATGAKWTQMKGSSGKPGVGPEDDFSNPGSEYGHATDPGVAGLYWCLQMVLPQCALGEAGEPSSFKLLLAQDPWQEANLKCPPASPTATWLPSRPSTVC